MTEFQKYWRQLKSLGYTKVWSTSGGGSRVDMWEKQMPADDCGLFRVVGVQIERSGSHRAFHSIFLEDTYRRGGSNTLPTFFNNPIDLLLADKWESSRRDNKRYAEL